MNVYEPCLLSKFAKKAAIGVHGNTNVKDSFV